MAAGEQADQQALDHAVLADDDLLDLEQGLLEAFSSQRRVVDADQRIGHVGTPLGLGGSPQKQTATKDSVKPRTSSAAPRWNSVRCARFGEVSLRTGTFPAVRILVVEDEIELADAMATGLRREGYAVDVANDVAGAIDRLVVSAYDLVTLDLNLPDGDGLELARRIREDPAFARSTTRSRPAS